MFEINSSPTINLKRKPTIDVLKSLVNVIRVKQKLILRDEKKEEILNKFSTQPQARFKQFQQFN